MRLPLRSDDVIEALVLVNCGESATLQARHLYRETLRSLVRLAKTEGSDDLKRHLLRIQPVYDENTLH